MAKKTPDSADRRDFLKLAGLGTLAGGATVVASTAQAAEPVSDQAGGYRETDHIKKVYETARF